MNASHENHQPTPTDDLHDRLLDVALTELISGHTPPDLSSRIAAALQPTPVARVRRAPINRTFWTHLAIAMLLLVGVTFALMPPVWSTREAYTRSVAQVDRLSAAKQRTATSAPLSAMPVPPRTSGNKELKEELYNEQLPWGDAGETASAQGPSESTAPLSDNLGLSGLVSDSAATTRPSSSRSETITWFNSIDRPATPGSRTFGFHPSIPQQHLDRSGSQGGPADVALRPFLPAPASTPAATPDSTMLAVTPHILIQEGEEERLGIAEERSKERRWRLNPESEFLARSGDKYTRIVENPFIKAIGGDAVSTFSIDVDTASYANIRQFLLQMNQLPPANAVRIEELINYFDYDYAPPASADATKTPSAPGSAGGSSDAAPFAAHVEVAGCPWNPEHRLARIAVKGREMDRSKRPLSNLVFLIDVSGSMNEPAKLPLVIYGLEQLTKELGENDHIAIVVYAGTEGVVLPSTSGTKQDTILAALSKLQAGGSTAGGAGIQLAYQIAEDNFIKGGTNRVILCTDGDFNVGVTSTADLQKLVEQKAKDTGVFLSTLGFGRGNLNDAMMVAISDHGNGNYHYIDGRTEARRVLVEEMTGTLVTIAKDVKIQVEFNPAKVAGYRLIGYEKRMLRTEDFNNDKKDAGEIGAGHTVTALYEIVPAGKEVGTPAVDPLKYQQPVGRTILSVDQKENASADGQKDPNIETDKIVRPTTEQSNELLTLKMRYKTPEGDKSKKLDWPITDDGKTFAAASGDLKFAASVAGFGLLLRDSQYKGNLTFAAVEELAQDGIGEDRGGYRREFLKMIAKAKELRRE